MGLFKKKEKKTANPANSSDISEIAKKYNIRVSAPHGYYPEDVDKTLTNLDKQLTLLSKENKILEQKNTTLQDEKNALKSEITKLKLQISTMEFPDTSTDMDYHMISKLSTINPSVGEILPEPIPKAEKSIIEPIVEDERYEEEITTPEVKETFDDLISKSKRLTEKPVVKKETPPAKKVEHQKKFNLEILGGNDE